MQQTTQTLTACTGDAATCLGHAECDHDWREESEVDDPVIAEEKLRMILSREPAAAIAGIIALGGARIVAICEETLDGMAS
jgi:hypothetical protein